MSNGCRRPYAAAGLAGVVALGLASRLFPIGLRVWDKSLGDVLYPVAIYLVVATVAPTLRPVTLGGVALAASLAVEFLQLTTFPARLPRLVRPLVGTTFAWHDVACYVVGATLVTLVHRLVVARRR
jgi:hypothetical protein